MNEKTLKLLEFDIIRTEVASRSLSEEAHRIILGEEPCLNRDEAAKLKNFTASLMERIISLEGENREPLPDIAPLFSKLDVEGAVLEIDETYALGIFINRAMTLKKWLLKPLPKIVPNAGKSGNNSPLDPVSESAGSLPDCGGIAKEIFRILDYEGNLRDLPEFRSIRKRIQSLQRDIETAGSRYAKNEETRRLLQSEIPSQRDGRMVLAVKANFRSRIRGIVHEVSSSGQTVFVEPEEVVEKNNELLVENRRLDAEIRRVLRELTGRIVPQRETIEIFHRGILFLETIRARARYGLDTKGIFALDSGNAGKSKESPESGSPGGNLILKKARHPLLGRRAVPLDLCMEDGIRTVIITGPNTGGKTVALKTLGLLSMMNQFGLALPAAEGTTLPVFDGIYADIGDEQSLSQSLSTFSGHMTNIADIVGRTSERSLVLLDELGAGTDPEEGCAIAMAILDHFIEEKIHLVVTTHHGILKNYGYTREGVENASMEFDSRTLSPTYRIIMGIPGESRAVDIASGNGFPPELIRRARSYLDEERSDVSALIKGLKEKHHELDTATEVQRKEERRLLEERRRADLKELRLRQKEFQLRSEGAGNLKRLLGESRKTLENLVREVKEGELNREKTLKVKEFLSSLEDAVRAEDAELEMEELAIAEERSRLEEETLDAGTGNRLSHGRRRGDGEELLALEPGVEVLAGESRRHGRILRLSRKGSGKNPASWIVEIGALKMSFSEKELIPVSPAANSLPETPGALWAADLAPSSPAKFELNLLGMRLGEALEALGAQIDAAILSGLYEFSVVHGKGDGILSKGVHGFLKKDPRVADYFFSRPELGGFGRTEVVIKK